MLAFVVGLQAEARLLSGRVFVGGGDVAGADRAARAAVAAGARGLVSFGLAGGLAPQATAGTLLVPRVIVWHGARHETDARLGEALGGRSCDALLSTDEVVAGRSVKAALRVTWQADGVDLESGAVAEAASRARLPFAALRAVCDPAWRSLPPAALLALTTSGRVDAGRVMRSVARHPGQVGGLLALARDAVKARRALRNRLAMLHRSGAMDDWQARA